MPIRILIADDHDLIRTGIRSIIDLNPDHVVVAEATNGKEALDLARTHRPDLIIMDVSMPGMNGMEATQTILKDLPGTKILALSMHEDRKFLVGMLKAGASGYMLKLFATQEMGEAIKTVMDNRTYLSPSMISGVVKDLISTSETTTAAEAQPSITPRQAEVLKHVVSGKSLKEIAYAMNLSVKTLEKHRMQVMKKLGANSIPELTMIAVRMGVIDPWELK
jgi:two-component system response regulator NreC